MPKVKAKYAWAKHTVGELRKVAKAYKEHVGIGAPSKMKKKDLILVLDKVLHLDPESGMIHVRATPQVALDVKKGAEPKAKKEKKAEDPEVKTRMEKLKSSYAKMTDKKEKEKSPEPMSLAEEMALAEAAPSAKPLVKKIKRKLPLMPKEQIPPKAMTQMMAAVADAMAIRAPEMPPKAMAQMLSAVADAMAIKAPEIETPSMKMVLTEYQKYKKAYEKLDRMKFTNAVDKQMSAIYKPAHKLVMENPLLQDQLRENYFLDNNENKIFFKINDKDGVSFNYFERPNGSIVSFKDIKDKYWNATKSEMTQEEWEFYKESSLFRYREDAYKNDGWDIMSTILGIMSYFSKPGGVKDLWMKIRSSEIKDGTQFKKFYDEL